MNNSSSNNPVYVVAVSGGIDSVVLLHILSRSVAAQRLVIAHFDHGIRDDSSQDRQFVSELAQQYGLRFAYGEGKLGKAASEDTARHARYAFLRDIKSTHQAEYIVTAHHEDDVLETAIINMLRGTGRKGLSSLRSHDDLYRPLLTTPKAHIAAYARNHGLNWHEDSTNVSTDYLRNHVRQHIMTKLTSESRDQLRHFVQQARRTNQEIDGLLDNHLYNISGAVDREWFTMLPHVVAKEFVAAWLRHFGIANFDRLTLERITVAAKTFISGKRLDINGRFVLQVSQDMVTIVPRSG
jgi:tRNA(Ile)-lysidine synthase